MPPVVPPPVVPPPNPPVVVESLLSQPTNANIAPINTTPDIFLILLITITLKLLKSVSFTIHETNELEALKIADADVVKRVVGTVGDTIYVTHKFYVQPDARVGVKVKTQAGAEAVIGDI